MEEEPRGSILYRLAENLHQALPTIAHRIKEIHILKDTLEYVYVRLLIRKNPLYIESPWDAILLNIARTKQIHVDDLPKYLQHIITLFEDLLKGKITESEVHELIDFLETILATFLPPQS